MPSKSAGRTTSLDKIADILSIFSYKIKILTKMNEGSVHIHAENIFLRLFNAIYDLNLKNLNFSESNYPSIDLLDEKKRIGIQVTATNTIKKITDTYEKFIEKGLYQKVDTLIIFITTEKKSTNSEVLQHKLEALTPQGIPIKLSIQDGILDCKDLYGEIVKLNNISKFGEIAQILKDECREIEELIIEIENQKSIYLSFSEDNFDVAHLLCQYLLLKDLRIFHSSSRLQEKLESSFDNLICEKEVVSKNIPFCVLILSDSFLTQKWINGQHCNILTSALDRSVIIPYYRNLVSQIPWSIKGKLTKISAIDFHNVQKISEDIFRRFERNTEEIDFNDTKDLEKIVNVTFKYNTIELLEEHKSHGLTIFALSYFGTNLKSYVIIFSEKAPQGANFTHITTKFPDIDFNNASILLHRERSKANQNVRLENFKNIFQPNVIGYIDEFIYNYTITVQMKDFEPFDIGTYVQPYLKDEANQDIDYEYLSNWMTKPDEPVLILKGSGGIGKTTMAMKMANEFKASRQNAIVIFVDSREIIQELRNKHETNKKIDLYSFYDSLSGADEHEKLANQNFNLNMGHGNILMIIDGLDEVMTSIPKFDAKSFLESVISYSPNNNYAKVVITCRSYFWDKSFSEQNNSISSIDIRLFDDELAEKYFLINHPGRPDIVIKSMTLARQLAYKKNGRFEYLPFVLAVVDKWISEKADEEDNDISFRSEYLSKANPSDYILYRIFFRETIRVNQMAVDKQIELFMAISTYNLKIDDTPVNNCRILEEELDFLAKYILPEISNLNLLAIKAHAFIHFKNDIVSFKYDFLSEYFRNIYVSHSLLHPDKKFDSSLIIILANHAKFYSSFVKEICLRLKYTLTDELLNNIKDLIRKIRTNKDEKIDSITRKKAICGLFYIALILKNKKIKTSVINNTEVLKDLFLEEGIIKDLSIIDLVTFDLNNKVVFDFTDLQLKDCYIFNFDYLWECRVNKDTRFVDSEIKKIGSVNRPKNLELKFENLLNCDLDDSVLKLLQDHAAGEKDTIEILMNDFRSFVGLFRSQGKLVSKIYDKDIFGKYNGKLINLKDMEIVLRKHGMLININEAGINKCKLTDIFKPDILNFLMHGEPSSSLNSFFKILLKQFTQIRK